MITLLTTAFDGNNFSVLALSFPKLFDYFKIYLPNLHVENQT